MIKKAFRKVKQIITSLSNEVYVFIATIVVGSIGSAYVYSLGLTRTLVDQNSHLNIARQILDSMTPGISQIGFWPSLIHVVMSPATLITPLYETGLAGAVTLVPIAAVGAVYLYKLLVLVTNKTSLGFVGVALFIANPYILYYSATPMSEILFISILFAVAYYSARWFETQNFSSLIFIAISITLAGLARFEGFLLIPVVALIIITRLLQLKKSYHEIEAYILLFGAVASLGVVFSLVYGFAFAGNPFEFLGGQWAAKTQQTFLNTPAAGDLGLSILYLIDAAKYMIGNSLLFIGFFSFALLMVSVRQNDKMQLHFMIAMILLTPMFFQLLSIYTGSAVIFLASLPPYEVFFNERYGLYLIGFIIFSIVSFLGLLNKKMEEMSLLNFEKSYVGFAVMLVLLLNFNFLFQTAVIEKYIVVDELAKESSIEAQTELGHYLRDNYDGGQILITRALHNAVPVTAGIPLKYYITESNFPYYENALLAPWESAKWVVAFNEDSVSGDVWRTGNERITELFANSKEFNSVYDVVFENSTEKLYKLNQDNVKALEFSSKHGSL